MCHELICFHLFLISVISFVLSLKLLICFTSFTQSGYLFYTGYFSYQNNCLQVVLCFVVEKIKAVRVNLNCDLEKEPREKKKYVIFSSPHVYELSSYFGLKKITQTMRKISTNLNTVWT